MSQTLINSIKEADQIQPRVKFKSYIKPFWNENLKSLRKSVMAARGKWLQKGSPRQRSNTFYMKYKKLKCEYVSRGELHGSFKGNNLMISAIYKI